MFIFICSVLSHFVVLFIILMRFFYFKYFYVGLSYLYFSCSFSYCRTLTYYFTSICSSYRLKTRCRLERGIAAGCMFTLSRRSPAAPRVDPGGVIVSDAPHHSQTVRLHTQQMSRNLTPEPEPTAGTVCAQTPSHTHTEPNQAHQTVLWHACMTLCKIKLW